MSLIEIDHVTFQYPGAAAPSLNDVSLTIEQGDFVAIMGGNGSGKTTMCKLLNGLIPHYYVGDIEGEIIVDGIKTLERKVTDLSQSVGYVYQDFENQLVRAKVIEDASYSPLNFGHMDYLDRGKKALEKVGLVGKDDEYIWELSGGQKHLLALAGAVSLEPKILIVDEPVAQLDPQHAKELYDVLKFLNEKEDTTVIVIEHHTEFVAEYCKNVVLMADSRVLWKKEVKEGLTRVSEMRERDIFPPQVTQAAHVLSQKEGRMLPINLEEAANYFQTYQIPEYKPTILEAKPKQVKEKLVEIQSVDFSYKMITREKKKILNGIDLTVHKGDRIALVGNNGAGKSTLMRLMTALDKPETGDVLLKGQNTKSASPEKFADLVTYIYQNPEEMFIDDSIKADIEYFLKARDKENYSEIVERILELFHLKEIQDRDGRLLSGGQQRRASLAIGVAMEPSLILLDEPTANLDIGTRKHIARFIQSLKDQAEAVIIATHDMQLVAEWANRIIVMRNGQIIHDGNRETVFSNKALLDQAGLTPPQIMELTRALGTKLAYSVEDFVAYVNESKEEEAISGTNQRTSRDVEEIQEPYKEAARLH
ncbi:ABC transporter ATP-binding protein [Marinilactibacillus piezotolerans]|uniref:ABC transporter ATP-binding protein n=1 Tax=Marinilactibacillus piezotolerans TaxID=258723 RepID=UPI0009AFF9E8|nr:energy-coupling factor transporter ATPase [Marinilactibacillus piezotolerans]